MAPIVRPGTRFSASASRDAVPVVRATIAFPEGRRFRVACRVESEQRMIGEGREVGARVLLTAKGGIGDGGVGPGFRSTIKGGGGR